MMSCELWTINRWLRYTGFRIFIELPDDVFEVGFLSGPIRVGIRWYGLPGSAGWKRIEVDGTEDST